MWRINLLFLVFILCHCGTISPDIVQAKTASIGTDGLQDSGVKGIVRDIKTGEKYFLITSEDRDDYNKKIVKYGKNEALDDAPMSLDDGIRPFGLMYAIDGRHFTDWALMIDLARADGVKSK